MKLTVYIFSITAIFCLFSDNAYSRSVYAITKCQGAHITAYEIQDEQIEYQTETQIDSGAIGLALDTDSEILFATFETSEKLKW